LTGAILVAAADLAGAGTGACARRREPPNQNLFWVCVAPGSDCDPARTCQTIRYTGIVSYSTCACRPADPDPDNYDYGTGGLWVTTPSAVPGPGTSVTFALAPGLNTLVVYPDADIAGDEIQNAQTFGGAGDFAGSFTVQFGAGADSLEAHVTALHFTMTSFDFEGQPTGPNTIDIAPDGPAATGWFFPATGTLRFDAPVHCLAANALQGSLDYFFRPILVEARETGPRKLLDPYTLAPTGRFVPAPPVGVEPQPWSRLKQLFR
jgi:hypothetical protein